jgi:hypothetical protein
MRALERGSEQALYLGDGQRDQAGVGRRGLAWAHGRRGLGVGAVPELGGGDGADGQGGRSKSSSTGQRSPAALISLVLVSSCPSGT